MDARNSKRRHERCWRAPQHDGFVESGSLRQPSPKRLRRNTTSYPKNTTDKEPEVTSLCSAAHPCATFECIFRRGAFVHNQREHEARPRTTQHPRTVSAHHNEHEEAEVNEQGAQSNARRHSTTQKNVQRRNDTYSQEDEDSQFRCCLFQAIVKSSCLGILWQSRFAHDLRNSRSVSSAEHGSRQLSWRTCGLTRRTKNHGTSLGEATGAFRRNTVYHVTSSTKSDGVSEPVCFVQMHRLGKNK